MDLLKLYVKKHPAIKHKLRMARHKEPAEKFIKKVFQGGMMLGISLTVLAFFLLSATDKSLLPLIIIFPLSFMMGFWFFSNTPDVYIRKYQRHIEKDVLFAGRFILVKIESGVPFFNAIEDAAHLQGTIGQFFNEIVEDVRLGTSIEQALENAIEYSPSEKFRRILWQVNNSLRTGIDIGDSLRGILKQITDEQIIEIKEYGKKLNSLAMFYMLIGVIVPALGITMFIILSSFISLVIPKEFMYLAVGLMAFAQFIFISIFRSTRPMVDI